jgi:hypothetical protein
MSLLIATRCASRVTSPHTSSFFEQFRLCQVRTALMFRHVEDGFAGVDLSGGLRS